VANEYTSTTDAIEQARRVWRFLHGIGGRQPLARLDTEELEAQTEELGKFCANEDLNAAVCGRRDTQVEGDLHRDRFANLAGLPNNDPRWKRELALHEEVYPDARQYMSGLRTKAQKSLGRSRLDPKSHSLTSNTPLMELYQELDLTPLVELSVIPYPKLLVPAAKSRRLIRDNNIRHLDALIVLLSNTADASRGVFVVSYSIAVGLTLAA
jgi:hypothetical protein